MRPSLLNQSLAPNNHNCQLTISCNSSFRALDTLSWFLQRPAYMWHIYISFWRHTSFLNKYLLRKACTLGYIFVYGWKIVTKFRHWTNTWVFSKINWESIFLNQEVVFSIQFLLFMANMYDVCNNSLPCRVSATLEETAPYLQTPRTVHISTTWGHRGDLKLSSCPLHCLHTKVTLKCLALRFHSQWHFSEAMESTSERGLLAADSARTF